MKTFPILQPSEGGPQSIPWGLIQAHAQQAALNCKGKTLDQIAEEGGLSVLDLYYVLNDKFLPDAEKDLIAEGMALFSVKQAAMDYLLRREII